MDAAVVRIIHQKLSEAEFNLAKILFASNTGLWLKFSTEHSEINDLLAMKRETLMASESENPMFYETHGERMLRQGVF